MLHNSGFSWSRRVEKNKSKMGRENEKDDHKHRPVRGEEGLGRVLGTLVAHRGCLLLQSSITPCTLMWSERKTKERRRRRKENRKEKRKKTRIMGRGRGHREEEERGKRREMRAKGGGEKRGGKKRLAFGFVWTLHVYQQKMER